MTHLAVLVVAVVPLAGSPAEERERVYEVATAPVEAPADPERIAHLRRELADQDLVRRAWAAWTASEGLVRELAPDVLAALRRTVEEPHTEQVAWLIQGLLDAAIRLEVRVPPSELRRTWESHPYDEQIVALAARAPHEHEELLVALRSTRRTDTRVAADNLLAAGAPIRAVELLLPDAHMEISIRVHTTDCRIGVHRWLPKPIACGSWKSPAGFPPIAQYRFVRDRVSVAVAVADGPRPISVLRSEPRRSLGFCGRPGDRLDPPAHALDLLRWIGGDKDGISTLTSIVDLDHTWTNAADYLAFVEAERRPCIAAWTKLVDALVARGALAPEKRPAEAPIEVVVEDLRTDTSVPLPELPR